MTQNIGLAVKKAMEVIDGLTGELVESNEHLDDGHVMNETYIIKAASMGNVSIRGLQKIKFFISIYAKENKMYLYIDWDTVVQ